MGRADLLALTDDALAALANRGIVKRSAREVAAGSGPTVVEDAGTVTASFADGTTVVLAEGAALGQSTCSCPATGICRHRVMLAIAYRESATSGPGPGPWSPGTISDEELEGHLGTRTFATARKARRGGYQARVRRATPADPVPTVELAASTVRFLVPHELGYARVDAAHGTREDAIALAVWAFRVADEKSRDGAEVDVEVIDTGPAAAANGSGIEPLLTVLGELLTDGVRGTGPAVDTSLARARHALDRANLRWPVDLLDDLADQLDAHRSRSSRYHPALAAAIVAESIGRHRCAIGNASTSRTQVLGTEEAAETPLRLLRLTGIGARVRGDDSSRTVECYLAHPDSSVVLAVRRRIEIPSDGDLPSGAALGRHKAGGIRLGALAAGNVVTESAVRSANRLVRITTNRLARTTVATSAGRWDDLPEGILVRDLSAEEARLAGLPPAVVRARVVADAVRAVAVESVGELTWSPGAQQLRALVHAPSGTAQVVATHTTAAPGAIDALARALGGAAGTVRFVAGHLRRHGGGIEIEPTAVVVATAAGTELVVPAFAEATGQAIGSAPEPAADPLAAVVGEAIDVSADLLHHGLRQLPPSWPQRAERTGGRLRRAGLTRTGEALTGLADVVRAGATDLLDRWADVHLRLLVTAEQL